MTPHDELMALAGKFLVRGEFCAHVGGVEGEDGGWVCTTYSNTAHGHHSRETAAFIAAACNFVRSDAFRAMVRDEWHSVPEKLPADGDVVLCYESRKGNQFVSQFMAEMPGGKPGFMEEFYEKAPTTDGCAGGYGHWPFVTHWRLLPAPPQAIDAAASGAGGQP